MRHIVSQILDRREKSSSDIGCCCIIGQQVRQRGGGEREINMPPNGVQWRVFILFILCYDVGHTTFEGLLRIADYRLFGLYIYIWVDEGNLLARREFKVIVYGEQQKGQWIVWEIRCDWRIFVVYPEKDWLVWIMVRSQTLFIARKSCVEMSRPIGE